ncbi:MAG: TetR family transcriptional regulator [Chloroflexi bacterium]|nr:TetR family transcriptional regulator [Chloroflexota bacterium]
MSELSLRERKKQRVRERILAATMDLFGAQGYSQTTMDEIAEKAEVSRATLFNYFPSKDSLLIPFVKEVFVNRILPDLFDFLSTNPPTYEALRFLFGGICDDILNVRGIEQAFKEQFILPEMHEATQDIGDDAGFLESLLEIVRYGQQRGEVRTDIALERQAHYIGVLFIAVFSNVVLQTGTANYAVEMESVLRFIQAGLQPC